MEKTNFLVSAIYCLIIFLAVSVSFGQRRTTAKPAPQPKTIVFAVLNDGQTLEPIGLIDKGELTETAGGMDEPKILTAFANIYYKPKTTYNFIFGGAPGGTVTVKSSNTKAECGKSLAQISTVSSKAKIKGLVMGLATNGKTARATSYRRMPTFPERAEIEALVRAEFTKQGVSANAVKNMDYHNLTALDVDSDGKAELVGTFWAENSDKERNLLFFIAEKDTSGKYVFGHSEYNKVTPDDVMSGDLNDLKDGRGHELLLDVFEFDGDKTAEIFTITQAFEGNNFRVYSKRDGKWMRIFEGYNYHCAF
jgi:hypothetical protein